MLLKIRVAEYVKSTAGFLVRGGLANQAKIIISAELINKTGQAVSGGAVGAWTFKNKSNAEVSRRAAQHLVRLLRGEPNFTE